MLSMNKIKTLVRRMRYRAKHDFFTVENVVLLIAIALCLMWTYSAITAMSRNWELAEKLTTERKELELVSVEVEAAELENAYYQSDEYQELMARKYLDKQLPGEKMVVMPENSEGAKNKHAGTVVGVDDAGGSDAGSGSGSDSGSGSGSSSEERDYSNFEKWMMFLFPEF